MFSVVCIIIKSHLNVPELFYIIIYCSTKLPRKKRQRGLGCLLQIKAQVYMYTYTVIKIIDLNAIGHEILSLLFYVATSIYNPLINALYCSQLMQ